MKSKDDIIENNLFAYMNYTCMGKEAGVELRDSVGTIFIRNTIHTGGVKLDEKPGLATIGYNGGYRGKKNSEYEDGHRVPFIMNIPYKENTRNRKIDRLSANIDFMPTLLDL
ncbi:sulfatase-like hydrolase/transferase (plasmid) [Fusobacteria bacterium ZRK30]|nr:sulfatase-like hydrolase/transferase [Fusobacteria bacterium ZRK30]